MESLTFFSLEVRSNPGIFGFGFFGDFLTFCMILGGSVELGLNSVVFKYNLLVLLLCKIWPLSVLILGAPNTWPAAPKSNRLGF